jgi:hypothetical protein
MAERARVVSRKAKAPETSLTSTGALIHWSRKLARLERELRDVRRRAAAISRELRFASRTLKALAQNTGEREIPWPPLRVFGELLE